MPSFSRSLEKALHQALAFASERHQEYATLEHLLLALIDDQDASGVMRACNVDLDLLRRNLIEYIDTELANLATGADEDSKPTAGFQRVIQRAVIHVQSSGREEVTGANVLVAIFAERESHAAFFLQEQDMTRYDAERLRRLIEKHRLHTNSARAAHILENWNVFLPKFVKVMPVDYRRALQEMQAKWKATEREGISVAVGY